MLLPGTSLDALLFLSALVLFMAPLLLNDLPLSVLVLTLLLLSLLRLSLVLFMAPLLLSDLLLPVLVLLSLLLNLLGLPLLLSTLLCWPGLLVRVLLLFGMVLLFALLLLLCAGRSSDSQKQRQDSCAGDSNCFHKCYLYYCPLRTRTLTQASYRCIDRAADGFARYKKLHPPVLLPSSGAVVGGYGQGVAETFCAD